MGLLDKVKGLFPKAKNKAADVAGEHGDKIDRVIDKGGDMVDRKTKGKYSEKVNKAQGAAKGAAGKLADKGDKGDKGDNQPGRKESDPGTRPSGPPEDPTTPGPAGP